MKTDFLKNGSGIHIKPSQRGSFTRYCGGNVTEECIRKGKNSSDPKIRKKATFAQNARRWKHQQGGTLDKVNNFLNSDWGKLAVQAGEGIYNSIKQQNALNKYKDTLEQWKNAQLNAITPEDYTQQIAYEEDQIKQNNPDYNSSPIVTAFKANRLAQNSLLQRKNALRQQLDNQIDQQLQWFNNNTYDWTKSFSLSNNNNFNLKTPDYLKHGNKLRKLFFGGDVPPARGTFITVYTPDQKKYIEDVYKYITDKGYSARQASAIMGNIMQESGWNPAARQIGGDQAYGLFQMHGDQYRAYRNYLTNTHRRDDLYAPIDYILDMINETKDNEGNILAPHLYTREYNRVINLKQTPENKRYRENVYGARERNNTLYLLPQLQKAWNDENVSLDELTRLFTEVIERAGRPQHELRSKYANEYYNYFNPPQR